MAALTMAIAFFLALGGPVHAQTGASRAQQAGSMEKGGPYVLKDELSKEQREGMLVEIRDWLWRHWHERRAGQLQIKETGKEGEKQSTYQIEPDSKGKWQMTVLIHQTSKDPWYPEQTYQQDFDIRADTVERLSLAGGQDVKRAPIPADTAALANTYRLVLRNKNGNIVHRF